MFIATYQLYALMNLMKKDNLNVFFGPLASCFLVHKIYLTMATIFCIFFRKMNQPTNIIIIDQGSPIPNNYLLSMITELLKSLVVATETLAPNDCSGK